MEQSEFVTSTFEPCEGFAADDGSPVCAHCGWLDDEHPRPVPQEQPRTARARAAA